MYEKIYAIYTQYNCVDEPTYSIIFLAGSYAHKVSFVYTMDSNWVAKLNLM